ncbi:unnamed protein product [Chilo suppressalis]|uniref:Protein kinase domain-containing protein n=1 Tax=Chilo suppressalis TaxID=168631 RepID=A0ABN8AWA9_CHISP|nr:unnamed protein product [Chilo suppressalis]
MTDLKTTPSEENTLSSKGYKLAKFLGEGAYAKVYLADFIGPAQKTVLACKIIETSKAPKDFVAKFLPREIDVLIRLSHPHLVHTHSIFQRKTKYYIFMRFAENGDLLGYILKNGSVSENQSRVWLRQLALGLQYLHELEISHRDIKCENVLLTANYNVKLADFGFTRSCLDDDDQPVWSDTYCGSMSYAAPEILRGKPYQPKPTDLWSLGVVLFVMLNKSMPFDDTRMRKLYEQQMGKKYRFRSRVASILSLECKTVVKHLLEPDPGLRHTATQVLGSEWIAMDSRLTSLNAVEASALKRAKEERRRLSDSHRNPPNRQGDILDGPQRRSGYRFYIDEDLKLTGSEQLTLATRGYKMIKKINEGSYAKVYLAEYRNPSKNDKLSILACKVIDTNTAPKDFVKKFLPREIEMLIKLNHPHLVHTHSIFQRRYKYFIFMRYMEHGDLLEYILQKGAVQEDQARIWARQLALAIQYMHELEIAHRDIKCENVLLTANHNAKLSDFGFARSCVDKKMNDIYSETFCGSLSYTAPEILQGVPYHPKPTDIWSLGVVIYVMLNRAMPFEDKQIKPLYQAQMSRNWKFRSRYADTISDSCKRLVTAMLDPHQLSRIKVDKIINGEWIAMDSRLLEWSAQETMAYKKARDERSQLVKDADPEKPEKEGDGLPDKTVMSITNNASSASYYGTDESKNEINGNMQIDPMTEKVDLCATPSDLIVLEERGFILEKSIGQGSYAKVYKATHMIDETRHSVLACKVIDTASAPRDYLTKFLPRELDVLIRINHPHVVHVSNIFQRRAKYFIFLRFAENGDLLDFLTQNGPIPENQSRLWLRQIISGIQYIHTLNIAHRDLKCENVLITANYNVKITDFGFARNVRQRDRDVLSETYCGSLSYAAPEVLKGVPYLPKMADMWSIGVILYTMLNKALPFNEASVKKLYEKQLTRKWRFRTNVVNQLSTECKQQVTQLMEPDAKARPTADEIFEGPWIGMDSRLTKLTFIEESLLKQAQEEAQKKEKVFQQDNEAERIAELRRKGRAKEGLKILKNVEANYPKSQLLFENQE